MANPTSGFQLSKLPEPLSIPTNIGVVDVGQMQKAYANAMQNVQDTALFGQRVAAQKAALDYQEQLARQQSRLLSPQEQALVAGYRADQLAKENLAIASGAQRPYVAPTARATAGGQLAVAETGEIGALAERGLAVPIGQNKALSSLYGAQADSEIQRRRAEEGGLAIKRVPIGNNLEVPVVVGVGGSVQGIGGAGLFTAASKSPSGYYEKYTQFETDSNGQTFGYRQVYKRDQFGNYTTVGPVDKIAITGAVTPEMQAGAFVPISVPVSNISQGVLAQQPAEAAAPAPTRFAAPTTPQNALSTFGGAITPAQTGLLPTPKAALAVEPAAAAPAPIAQPSPFLPPPGTPATEAPVTQVQAETVKLPWLRNREVAADSPLALTDAEFREYAAKRVPSRMTPALEASRTKFTEEIFSASQALQQKTDALSRLAVAAKRIEEEGIGTGAWQKYVPQDLLQLLGDPSKQDFNSAVNELVNKLSEDTRFRNFAVVDLIRSTKPEQSDDPSVVTSKIDYLAKGLARWQDAMAAANHGIKLGLTPIQIRTTINSNFTDVPYEEFARQNPASPISRSKAAPNTIVTGSDLSRAPSGLKSQEELMKALGLTIAPNN